MNTGILNSLMSNRLKAVSELVPSCGCVADIGCDHGYISIDLIKRRVAEHVIAMDLREGPLMMAKENIRKYLTGDRERTAIETRLSDGMKQLKAGETDGIICAGMGGKLIIQILENSWELVQELKFMVLQPQSELVYFRTFLAENGFVIEDENLIFEEGKYYPMVRVSKGKPYELNQKELLCGPILLRRKPIELINWLCREREINRKILANLQKEAQTETISARLKEIEEAIGLIDEILEK
ncbi:MAG: SAM-dependent methyltransferase [Lachnospiraceae bacterium]|nr:SAM-dependent methyltransferase [Candidatus Merdinaster equi]